MKLKNVLIVGGAMLYGYAVGKIVGGAEVNKSVNAALRERNLKADTIILHGLFDKEIGTIVSEITKENEEDSQ